MTHGEPRGEAPRLSPSPADPVAESPAFPSRLHYLPSIYGALLLILLSLGGVYLVVRLRFLFILLFLSILLACGIAGPVRRLERLGIPRAAAILIVYLVIGGIFAGIAVYALPRLVGQAQIAAQALPEQVAEAQRLREQLLTHQDEYPVLEQLDARLISLAEGAGARASRIILALPTAVATTVFSVTSILTIAFLFLMTWRQLKATILSVTHPAHRPTLEAVLAEIGSRLGAYLRAKAIVVVIIGIWVYATLALLDSPYAVLAAIFAGAMEVLPKIGPWFGRAAIVLAAAPLGWEAIVIAVISHVVIENIKGYGLGPMIEGSQVDIHPLTAFIAVIAGGLLLGWVGAFVAVPAAAVVQVIVEDVLIPWRRRQLAPAEANLTMSPPVGESSPAPSEP